MIILYFFFSFREDLRCISEKIHKRNEKLEKKYDYLLPEDIPNSISASIIKTSEGKMKNGDSFTRYTTQTLRKITDLNLHMLYYIIFVLVNKILII